jgi:hypothetical protein
LVDASGRCRSLFSRSQDTADPAATFESGKPVSFGASRRAVRKVLAIRFAQPKPGPRNGRHKSPESLGPKSCLQLIQWDSPGFSASGQGVPRPLRGWPCCGTAGGVKT